MEKNIVQAVFPQVAGTAFGKKMFKKVSALTAELCEANADELLRKIEANLRYHPGASEPQRVVFEFLADIARQGDWRLFVAEYGELVSPGTALSVLGEKGRSEFFQPY